MFHDPIFFMPVLRVTCENNMKTRCQWSMTLMTLTSVRTDSGSFFHCSSTSSAWVAGSWSIVGRAHADLPEFPASSAKRFDVPFLLWQRLHMFKFTYLQVSHSFTKIVAKWYQVLPQFESTTSYHQLQYYDCKSFWFLAQRKLRIQRSKCTPLNIRSKDWSQIFDVFHLNQKQPMQEITKDLRTTIQFGKGAPTWDLLRSPGISCFLAHLTPWVAKRRPSMPFLMKTKAPINTRGHFSSFVINHGENNMENCSHKMHQRLLMAMWWLLPTLAINSR